MRWPAPLLVSLAGCGLGIVDNPSGGDINLPTQAAGPYGKPDVDFATPADEPYVLEENLVQLREPDALARAGGGFRLWYSHQSAADAAIWYAELPTVTDLPDVAPAPALVADAAWEQGRVAAPSIVDLGDGRLVMFYEGGDDAPAIGRADSSDDGASWDKDSANPILTGAHSPAGALVDDTWWLYVGIVGEPSIWRAVATSDGDGGSGDFQLDAAPVLTPRPDLAEAFDAESVASPDAVVTVSEAGRRHFGLFFTGGRRDGDDLVSSIGYAGSFDGARFERFGGAAAVLDSSTPSESAPCVVVLPGRGVMFFGELRQNTSRIGVAEHP